MTIIQLALDCTQLQLNWLLLGLDERNPWHRVALTIKSKLDNNSSHSSIKMVLIKSEVDWLQLMTWFCYARMI